MLDHFVRNLTEVSLKLKPILLQMTVFLMTLILRQHNSTFQDQFLDLITNFPVWIQRTTSYSVFFISISLCHSRCFEVEKFKQRSEKICLDESCPCLYLSWLSILVFRHRFRKTMPFHRYYMTSLFHFVWVTLVIVAWANAAAIVLFHVFYVKTETNENITY